MNWSAEQLAIFNFFREGRGNLIVKARAGTGKTTTIKAAFEHAPEDRILYAVFNKKNQKEAEAKITDSRVEVKTLHSLGFAFIKRVWGAAKPDDDVEFERADSVLTGHAPTKEMVAAVVKLVAFLKNTTINPTQQDAYNVAQEQDILTGESAVDETIVCASLRVLDLSRVQDRAGRISFNDMVWLPVAMGWVRQWYDLVCIDEAQDMNLPQLSMARGACKPGGRVVVVGDDRQAIYGFRGAVQNGMTMMKVTLRAAELGLTTTYRCPKAVVEMAKEIVPDYQAAPEAPEGIVSTINGFAAMTMLKPGDAVLSRLNAPLMPMALALLRKGTPARIEGRDIGKQLVGMVRSMKASNVPSFVERVNEWATKQRERLAGTRNAEKKLEVVSDIAATLIALSEGVDTVAAIETRLNDLFQDTDQNSKPAVILSSVHKAKGLEWGRCFLLSETFRGKGGTNEEANIYYVALTRSQRELYFVGGAGVTTVAQPAKAEPEKAEATPVVEEVGVSTTAPTAPAPVKTPSPASGATGSRPKFGDEPLIKMEVGMVVEINGVEHIVTMVDDSEAIVRPNAKERTRLLGNMTAPGRVLRRENVEKFLSRPRTTVSSVEGAHQQQPKGTNMAKKADGRRDYSGLGPLIVKLFNAGTPKGDAWKKRVEAFGWDTKKGKEDFDRRWARCEKEAKAAAKGEKPAKAKKASAKTSKAAPKKKAAKPAAKGKPSGPPPRPQPAAAPAAAPAPAPVQAAPAASEAAPASTT